MQEDKFKLINYSMHYGVVLGLFWVFKYLFAIGGAYYDGLMYIYSFLGVGTCIIIPYLTTRYRDKANGGKISYFECIKYTLFLCFFGSLIEAVVAYLYFAEINPGFIASLNKTVFEWMQILKVNSHVVRFIQDYASGPVSWVVLQVAFNLLIGLCIALIYGIFISNQEKFK